MNVDKLPKQPKQQSELETPHGEDELVFEDPAEGFRRGWQDMLNGNTISASKLLDTLNQANLNS